MKGKIDFETLDSFAFASRKLPEFMHFQLMHCRQCELLYVSPAPELSWMQSAYRQAAFDAGTESTYAAKSYRGALERIVRELPRRETALDIGAGDGAFVLELLDLGFTKPMGIEPSRAPVERARHEVRERLHNDFFQAEKFQPASLDLVTCFQTLEHVEGPLELARSINRLLAPGGAFLTVAHDYQAPLARLLGQRSPIYDIEHLQLFSVGSLKKLLEVAGFRRVKVWPLRNTYPLAYWLRLLPVPGKLKSAASHWLEQSRWRNATLSAAVGNLVAVGFKE